jgi:hypothetical protein
MTVFGGRFQGVRRRRIGRWCDHWVRLPVRKERWIWASGPSNSLTGSANRRRIAAYSRNAKMKCLFKIFF